MGHYNKYPRKTKLARGFKVLAQMEICLSGKKRNFPLVLQSASTRQRRLGYVNGIEGRAILVTDAYEINRLELIHGQLFKYFVSTGQRRWVTTQQKET